MPFAPPDIFSMFTTHNVLGQQITTSEALLYQVNSLDFGNRGIDIYDVRNGKWRQRVQLNETVSFLPLGNPITVDQDGRRIFLITNAGFTLIDLGQPPLSIGTVSPPSGSAETQAVLSGTGFTSNTVVTVNEPQHLSLTSIRARYRSAYRRVSLAQPTLP